MLSKMVAVAMIDMMNSNWGVLVRDGRGLVLMGGRVGHDDDAGLDGFLCKRLEWYKRIIMIVRWLHHLEAGCAARFVWGVVRLYCTRCSRSVQKRFVYMLVCILLVWLLLITIYNQKRNKLYVAVECSLVIPPTRKQPRLCGMKRRSPHTHMLLHHMPMQRLEWHNQWIGHQIIIHGAMKHLYLAMKM